MTTLDAARYKQITREQWQAAARAWGDWGPFPRARPGPTPEIMLDMAGIVRAAESSMSPQVLATRCSGSLIESARKVMCLQPTSRERPRLRRTECPQRRYTNANPVVMDGENSDVPEGTSDAVISRVRLIYFPISRRRSQA